MLNNRGDRKRVKNCSIFNIFYQLFQKAKKKKKKKNCCLLFSNSAKE